MGKKVSSESVVKDIRRRTRTKYSSEEKIRIVLDGIRAEISPAELCRRESISSNLYYRMRVVNWPRESQMERVQGGSARPAANDVTYAQQPTP